MPAQHKIELIKHLYEHGGEYFHVFNPAPNGAGASNERIIVNVKNQDVAARLVQAVADKWDAGGAPGWQDQVASGKFFAQRDNPPGGEIIKYDKVVMYFNNDVTNNSTRNEIIAGIQEFLNANGGQDALKPEISGFYKQAQPGIGMGVEIAGTSFTTERTNAILDMMDARARAPFATKQAFVDAAFAAGVAGL